LAARKFWRKHITAEQAQQGFRFIKDSVPRLFNTIPLLERALDLALDNQMSLWDSVYLALALEHHCPLITADRRLFRGHSPRHPAIQSVELLGERPGFGPPARSSNFVLLR
jgi:predicted nucleic acid-binding protein